MLGIKSFLARSPSYIAKSMQRGAIVLNGEGKERCAVLLSPESYAQSLSIPFEKNAALMEIYQRLMDQIKRQGIEHLEIHAPYLRALPEKEVLALAPFYKNVFGQISGRVYAFISQGRLGTSARYIMQLPFDVIYLDLMADLDQLTGVLDNDFGKVFCLGVLDAKEMPFHIDRALRVTERVIANIGLRRTLITTVDEGNTETEACLSIIQHAMNAGKRDVQDQIETYRMAYKDSLT